MEATDVEGVAADFDTGINRGLGTGSGMYHFAFKVADVAELAKKRDELVEKGLKVRGIVDHGWCQSIYFRDPNFLQLEFCCLSRELAEKDVAARRSESWKSLTRS